MKALGQRLRRAEPHRARCATALLLLFAACSPWDSGREEGARETALETANPEQRGYYDDWEVDEPTWPRPNNPTARYPQALVAEQREGHVLLEFVVAPTGRVDMSTVKVIYSEHPLFTAAAREALRRARYDPAKKGGRSVRQRTRQAYSFRSHETGAPPTV